MRINKTLLGFILASLLAHAVFLTLCYLAPRDKAEPPVGSADCVGPSSGSSGPSNNDQQGTAGAGSMPTVGTASHGATAMVSGAALGPKVTIRTEAVFWPCCGPGCPSEIEVPH